MAIDRTTFGGVTYFTENGKEFLSISENTDPSGKTVEMSLAGNLRSDVRFDFSDELMLCVAMKKDIILNFENLEKIANSCMSVMLEVQQNIDQTGMGSLTIRSVPKVIYRSLDIIGLTDLLMIEG